jgi:tRNA guanosine-2'-O-methyltransferase
VIADFVRDSQLSVESVDAFIHRGDVDPAVAKQLVNVLCPTTSAAAFARLVQEATSLAERTSMPADRRLCAALLFAEVAAVMPLSSAFDHVKALGSCARFAVAALQTAVQLIDDVASTEALRDDEWFVIKAEHFDVVCAACFECVRRHSNDEITHGELPSIVHAVLDLAKNCITPRKTPSQEYCRLVCVRNCMRSVHSLISASIVPRADRVCGLSAWKTVATRETVQDLLSRPHPHLVALDVPSPLSSLGWGVVIAQHDRYLAQLCVAFLDVVVATPDLIHFIGTRAADMLDVCSLSNLSAAFDLLSYACRQADESQSELVAHWLRVMLKRLLDENIRREAQRCYAILAFTLVANVATDVSYTILEELIQDSETPDRTICFVATAIASAVVANPARYAHYRELLLYLAIFRNQSKGAEDELDASLACTEPCVSADYWTELRRARPPSTNADGVAKCAAICTLLNYAQSNRVEAVALLRLLLRWNAEHPIINKVPCMPDSTTHRCRIRLWQLACGLTPLLVTEDWPPIIRQLADEAFEVINMGSVRRYMELIMMAGLNQCPDMYTVLIDKFKDVDLRAQVCGSHALAAFHVMKRWGQQKKAMRDALMPILVRLCASHFHIIRLTAQIGVHDLGMHDPKFAALLSPEVLELVHLVEHNADAKKFRERHWDVVVFDEDEALQPRAIFSTQRKEGDCWLHDSVAPAMFDRVSFIYDELQTLLGVNSPFEHYRCEQLLRAPGDARAALMKLRTDLPLVPHTSSGDDGYLDFAREITLTAAEMKGHAPNTDTDNLQRKVTSWWNSEVHNELHPRAVVRGRQQLVVVATLLEYPVNIAGLCRCAEIFGIEKVIVPDRKVFQKPEFIGVARSAELWMPWEEVPKSSLAAYLSTMRQLGYTIVGVEQTADSVPLQTYDFPERTVVVLGAEGTGVPANFLPCLDVCLEIPQFGLIRSLNVHVTGAVAIYEYTRQHLMEKRA